jgi:hypothetical protein
MSEVNDEDTLSIMRGDKAEEVCAVEYTVLWTGNPSDPIVTIKKDTYKDYFKVGGRDIAIPRA